MNCPPPDALRPCGCSLPTSESPWPAVGQCASGEETSYWELWTQNTTRYTGISVQQGGNKKARLVSGGVVKQEVQVQLKTQVFGGKRCRWEGEIQPLYRENKH